MRKVLLVAMCVVTAAGAGAWADEEAADAPAAAVAPPCEPACDCPPALMKVCMPAPHKKKHTHVEYRDKCEDYCLPKCGGLGCLFGKKKAACGCEDCIQCDKVRVRKKLVKRIKVEECDELKCEPTWVPCGQPCPAPCETPCAAPVMPPAQEAPPVPK
jgi:hypothetical protein